MAISVRERFGELGTLKAIGFSDRRILFFVLAEALIISLVGGLLGLGLAALAIPVLAAALNGLLPTLILSPAILSVGLATALLVGVDQRPAARHRRDAHARRQRAEESLTMAIPVIYNVRSVKARWTSAIVAVLGHRRHRRRLRRHALARPRLQSHARRVRFRRQRHHHARRRHFRNDERRRPRASQDHARRSRRRARRKRPAGHLRSRGHRAVSAEIHRHRRQRPGSRRLRQRHEHPQEREDR